MRSLACLPTVLFALATYATGCDEIGTSSVGGGGSGGASSSGTGAADPFAGGTPLDVPTGEEPTYVDLDGPAIVTADDAWELKFDGKNIQTNGGVSGSEKGAAFGPLDLEAFADDGVPSDVPFLFEDEFGGAFARWFAYDGAEHVLYSRFHVYGIRRGGELYKLQVLGFYGEAQGAPLPGLYRLRYARVTEAGVEETVEIPKLDGTAGGTSEPTDDDASGCIRLDTGAMTQLTPAEAKASDEWDVCFRRATISVNGGDGAAADVEAVDLDLDQTAGEMLSEIAERTAESELAAFDAVDAGVLMDPSTAWLSDGVISAFTNRWFEVGSDPLVPASHAWLVASSDGETPFFVGFESFTGATASSPGTIALRVKAIGGTLP